MEVSNLEEKVRKIRAVVDLIQCHTIILHCNDYTKIKMLPDFVLEKLSVLGDEQGSLIGPRYTTIILTEINHDPSLNEKKRKDIRGILHRWLNEGVAIEELYAINNVLTKYL